MAAKTWFVSGTVGGTNGTAMQETDPGTEATLSPATGWVVGTGSTNHSEYYGNTERASSTFVNTTPPDGTLDTTNGDFWVSNNPYTGDFASGNWNVHFACRAVTNGGTQDGRIRCRLFRGANIDGSSATEITAAQQQGGLVTDLATGVTQVSTATFNPGAFSVSNEHIFIQLAWERTGAGGMTSADVNLRIGNASGSGSRVISSDFSSGITGSLSKNLPVLTLAAAGTVAVAGALSKNLPVLTLSAASAVAVAGALSKNLPTLTLVATGSTTNEVTGSASVTLPKLTLAAAGVVAVAGSLGVTLPLLSLVAAATVAVVGSANITLPRISLSAEGFVGGGGGGGPGMFSFILHRRRVRR